MSFYHGAAPCVVGVYEITATTPSYRHTQGLRLELNFPPNCPKKNPKFEFLVFRRVSAILRTQSGRERGSPGTSVEFMVRGVEIKPHVVLL